MKYERYEARRSYAPPGKNVDERRKNAERYLARFIEKPKPKKMRPFFPPEGEYERPPRPRRPW